MLLLPELPLSSTDTRKILAKMRVWDYFIGLVFIKKRTINVLFSGSR